LIAAAARLQALLDANWRTYLALPAVITAGGQVTDFAGIEHTLRRFDTVAADPRYAAISGRAEFQTMHQLLRQFLTSAKSTIALPPPPGR
jgi:hypothetical protein